MRRYRVEMTSTNRETCSHTIAAPNRGVAMFQAMYDHQDQGHRRDVASIIVTADSKPFRASHQKAAGRTPEGWSDADWRHAVFVASRSPEGMALLEIIANAPEQEPGIEDYDDTESASSQGVAYGWWEAAEIAKRVLARVALAAPPEEHQAP